VAHVCRVVRFYLLQGVLLIRISATPSDMGETFSPSPNVVILLSYCYTWFVRWISTTW
jgi:hypothetical protein